MKKNPPIPVHLELKGTRGKIRPKQIVQKKRIERSGSIFLLIDNPYDFHKFFLDHGLDRMKINGRYEQKPGEVFTEKQVARFVRDYLKAAENIYGIYWERNHQSLGSNQGRPDFFFEIPNQK